ncbi:MAG: threonine synthase [Deltaproteobacteria bacterium]|nr:threonine synthase [Deltaproteobacteria bacterium]
MKTTTTTLRLRCFAQCGDDTRFDLFRPLVECPRCGGLLDVDVDFAALPARPNKRLRGVWGYRDWIAPDLDDADMVTLGEGDGALLSIDASSWLYDCGRQPTGSFKDLGMTVLVSCAAAMRRRGQAIDVLLCASTGDTSAALAAYGARAGIPVAVLVPRGKVSDVQLVQPQAHGARVVAVDGDFDDCMRVVQDLSKRDGVYLANSKNPLRLLGQSTVAFDVVDKLGTAPDFVFVPSGNLGNVYAIFKGFGLLVRKGVIDKMPRMVACQVDAANPLHVAAQTDFAAKKVPQQSRETHATAIRIGDPVSFPRARVALIESNGLSTSSSEAALLEQMAKADRQGFFVCPQTAVALDGLAQLRARGVVTDKHVSVVVATASGLKFATQKAAFHAGSTVLGDLALPPSTSSLRNPIRSADANADAVWQAIS